MQFLVGVVIGIVISTIGFTGVAHLADRGVNQIQSTARDMAR